MTPNPFPSPPASQPRLIWNPAYPSCVPSPGRAQGLAACRGGNEMSGVGWPRLRGFVGQHRPSPRARCLPKKGKGLKQRATQSLPGMGASVRPFPSGVPFGDARHKERMAGNLRCSRDRVPQGSDRPAGGYVGKALRASLVLGEACSVRPRPTATGQTSRAERRRDAETHSTPRSPGIAPGAPPAHPTFNRLCLRRRGSVMPGL